MDIGMRIKICRLLTYVQNDSLFAKRIGIKDVSYFKASEHSKDHLESEKVMYENDHHL